MGRTVRCNYTCKNKRNKSADEKQQIVWLQMVGKQKARVKKRGKEREEKNSGRKKKVRKKSRTTEFSITIVLCCLVAVLTVKGISLQQKVNANASRLSSLDSQIEEEKQRTDDITALKEYMQTDEYIEKTAREKLGMVKDNEILFKESQSK